MANGLEALRHRLIFHHYSHQNTFYTMLQLSSRFISHHIVRYQHASLHPWRSLQAATFASSDLCPYIPSKSLARHATQHCFVNCSDSLLVGRGISTAALSYLHVSSSKVPHGSSHSSWTSDVRRDISTSCLLYRYPQLMNKPDISRKSSKRLLKTASPGPKSPPATSSEIDPDLNKSPDSSNPSVITSEKMTLDPQISDVDKYYTALQKIVKVRTPRRNGTAGVNGVTADPNKDGKEIAAVDEPDEEEPKTLWARFKTMYKKYWYVLIPVHGVLGMAWYGFFYYLASRGFDVIPYLERLGLPEHIMAYVKKSGAGYLAAAFAMYKLATPLRYSVTLGATTLTINYLTQHGYIKPVPSAAKLKQMIKDRGEDIKVLSRRGKRRLKRIRDRYSSSKPGSSSTSNKDKH